jgi:hypothetical protein
MSTIPYIIIDERKGCNDKDEKYIDYSSAPEEKINSTLLKELHYCMEYHCFFDDSDIESDEEDEELTQAIEEYDKELTCSECECIVTSKKFIAESNGSLFCFACNPSETIGDYITKEIFDKFIKFLDKNDEICDILYFKNNKWNKFVIE